MKILSIIGARPQFVKAGVLSRAFLLEPTIEEVIVHTGQHFDENMSEIFFQEMEIPKPKYNLEINSLSHGAMTGRMLEGVEEIILIEKPDLLLVYGDTNSTIAGALAAKKAHVKVAHVEAGLRSFNMKMPEEVNRILTDRISDYLFCPTDVAIANLHNEGYKNIECQIIKSGDVMQDAANFYAQRSAEKSTILNQLGLDNYCLTTLHRAENTDNREKMTEIVAALNCVHETIVPVVLPLHPRTKAKLNEYDLDLRVKLIDPVGYFDMIELIKNSSLVMTDSGGLQKEAFFFQRKCVTLRDQTEWVELVDAKVNILSEANENAIVKAVHIMLAREVDFNVDLYGNGNACQNIVNHLMNH